MNNNNSDNYKMSIALTASLWLNFFKSQLVLPELGILFMNRNARAPKKANHGARPCSSVMRKERKK
jgi:hypothetical protein